MNKFFSSSFNDAEVVCWQFQFHFVSSFFFSIPNGSVCNLVALIHWILWAFANAMFPYRKVEKKRKNRKKNTLRYVEWEKANGIPDENTGKTQKDKHALPTMKHIIIMLLHLIGSFRYCVTWHLSWSHCKSSDFLSRICLLCHSIMADDDGALFCSLMMMLLMLLLHIATTFYCILGMFYHCLLFPAFHSCFFFLRSALKAPSWPGKL